MARVSRKGKKEGLQSTDFRTWKTAIYGRVSKFNSGQEDAESLEVQIYYVSQYMERMQELHLVDIYADNGFTGRNFERPEFERLLADIYQKKIDCVVVKDLSRFGRNVLDAGYYLERLFPSLGVRFIAVNENYDSEDFRQQNGLILPIKDLMNELYSRDLAKKVRSTFALKREQGDNLHVVPFGYRKDAANSSKLVLDEAVSEDVRMMFEWKRDGWSYAKIAKKLNADMVPIPHERRKQLGLVKTPGRIKRTEWDGEDVRHILTNPVYTGNMVYNRLSYPNGYKKTCVLNPKEKWIVTRNSHPAIISEELFDCVEGLLQTELSARAEKCNQNKEERDRQPNLFRGIVYCAHCQTPLRMVRINSLGKPRFQKLYCSNSTCTEHVAIAEPLLRILIMDQIRMQITAYVDLENLRALYQNHPSRLEKEKVMKKQCDDLQGKLNQIGRRKQELYEEYAKGDWLEKDYLSLRDILNQKEMETEGLLLTAKRQLDEFHKLFQMDEKFRQLFSGNLETLSFSQELLNDFVRRIEIGSNNAIAVTFSFQDQVLQKNEVGGGYQMIGTYYRLSQADEDIDHKKSESSSIANQRMAVTHFIQRHKDLALEQVCEYVDDGYTGTNINRPAFDRLMQDVRSGKIKTIVVKDLSRFARDYIEAGDYIERIFPFMGVRFIAVQDGYDSALQRMNHIADMEVGVKNIINASYSRDLSAKIAATNQTKRKQQMYLGGYRPFGFLPDPEDCHKLILDPVASKYVRLIFDLAIEGNGIGKIARILNERGIPTSGQYFMAQKQVKMNQKSWQLEGTAWTSDKVYHILQNEKYKGTFVAKKVAYPIPCKKKRVTNDPEQVIRHENSHIGIVTPEEFDQAQKIFRKQNKTVKRQIRNYPLKGKVICGYCGRHMAHYDRVKTGEVYVCRYSAGLENSLCDGKPIASEMLEALVMNAFAKYWMLFHKVIQMLENREWECIQRKIALEKEQESLQEHQTEIVLQKAEIYEQYAEAEIDKDTFLQRKREKDESAKNVEMRLDEIKNEIRSLSTGIASVHQEMKENSCKQPEQISMEFAEAFLDSVVVYNGDRVEIRWKYADEISRIFSKEMQD